MVLLLHGTIVSERQKITALDTDTIFAFSLITLDPLLLENCLKMSYSGKLPKDINEQGDKRRLN